VLDVASLIGADPNIDLLEGNGVREEVDQLDDVDGDRTVGMCFG
tara:strand:+ start:1855 stop:1986 length:132 start_codon:yes stop_codon:yes gene_type:complete